MPKLFLSELCRSLSKNRAEFIDSAEKYFDGELCGLSDYLCQNRNIKVVLLSGPSGSGKTTAANILKDKLLASKRSSAVVSLDDFFLNKDCYPKNERGEPDYESVYALDIPLVKSCIADIAASGKTSMPRFDFPSQQRQGEYRSVDVGGDGIVIIEGIHALNPIISSGLDSVFKVFVSVSTGIKDDSGREIISGIQIRMLRRLIRDRLYRGFSFENTLNIWQSVLSGEQKYLYPYKPLADYKINTFHCFEAFVYAEYIRKYMSGEAAAIKGEYGGLFRTLVSLPGIDLKYVPETSLIREFVPGGVYEHIYKGNS